MASCLELNELQRLQGTCTRTTPPLLELLRRCGRLGRATSRPSLQTINLCCPALFRVVYKEARHFGQLGENYDFWGREAHSGLTWSGDDVVDFYNCQAGQGSVVACSATPQVFPCGTIFQSVRTSVRGKGCNSAECHYASACSSFPFFFFYHRVSRTGARCNLHSAPESLNLYMSPPASFSLEKNPGFRM